MRWLMIILAVPILVRANIKVDIIASEDQSEHQVHISGSEIDVISNKEIETFGLYNEKLKNAVYSYIGKKPDDVFLKSPTPWNDLYKTYGWEQVTRILKPIKAKILPIKYLPKVVAKQSFSNPSNVTSIYKTVMCYKVENTVASSWETSGELTAGLNISYGVNIAAMASSGNATMHYASKWGENFMKQQMIKIGSEVALEITLQPNQSVVAKLFATTGNMKVKIDYEAILTGTVAVNFHEVYKSHHFWGVDVDEVMSAGRLNKSVLSSEEIILDYYIDSELEVRDIETNDIMYYQ